MWCRDLSYAKYRNERDQARNDLLKSDLMTCYVNTDIDLLEVIQMSARPVDRIQQADIISYTPELPNVKNKIIIINKHYENQQTRIDYLAQNNKIINRDESITNYPVVPYDQSVFEVMSLSKDRVHWSDKKLQLVMLDDLLISNKQIIW